MYQVKNTLAFGGMLMATLSVVSCASRTGVVTALTAAVPERFAVVSQQLLDSGAKLVVIKDQRTGKCYAIYEAGMGAPLEGRVPCR